MNRTIAVLATCFAASPAMAQSEDSTDSRIEEVFVSGELSRYSAMKSDTPIMETSRSVSIISAEEINNKGVLRLDEALTYSSGVFGETFGFATRGDWFRVRGLSVPQYQDSLQSLFGNYNNTRPDVYTLEQIEVLKGPASVLYGKGSPGGLVNVISKTPKAESHNEIVLEAGSFNHTQIAGDSTGTLSKSGEWLYRVVGVYRDAETQVDHVEDKTIAFAPSIAWEPSDATRVTLLTNYTKTEGDTAAQFLPLVGTLVTAANGERIESSTYLGDPSFNQYDAETLAVTLLAEHQLNDVWSMEFTSRYTDAEADYKQAWPTFFPGPDGNPGNRYVYNPDGSLYLNGTVPRSWFRSDASSEQAATDIRFRADFSSGEVEHRILIGAQYQDVTTDDDGYYAYGVGFVVAPELGDAFWINVFDPVYGNTPPEALLDPLYTDNPETESTDYGFYLSDQISIGDLHINIGFRYDETETTTASVSQDDDAFSGSLGFIYEFDNGFAPYISYAESFEPVIGDNGNGEPLKPQEGKQTEIGIKYTVDSLPAFFTIAAFDIEQSNLSDPQALGGSFEQQRGIAEIQGAEFEGTVQIDDFTIEVNLTKLDTESADGFRLPSVPEEQASSWVNYQPQAIEGFRTGAGVRYVGETYGGVDQIRTPSYTLVDLMFGYTLNQWDFSIHARNAGDKEYYATCLARGDCFPGKERMILGKVSVQF